MRDSKHRASRLVCATHNLPPVGGNDLVHDREAEADAFRTHRDIWLEDIYPIFFGHAGSVVAYLQSCLARSGRQPADFYVTARGDGLHGVQQQIEERLTEKLFIGLD